jgi:hypothetical protein
MRNRIFVFIILFILSYSLSIAQDINVGLKYGIGSTHYFRLSDDAKTDNYRVNKGAFVLEFSPFLSKIFICSGFEYITNDLGAKLSVPLTFRLAFFKKVRPFLEGGGYYNLTLSDKADSYLLKNDLGAKVGCGLMVHLSKRWRIEGSYFRRFGFTSGLEENIILPLGQVQVEEFRLKESSIEFCMKYRF